MSDLAHAAWRKSSESFNGDCVELAPVDGTIAIRDSKDPSGPVLRFSRSEWSAFLRGAKNGEFDAL